MMTMRFVWLFANFAGLLAMLVAAREVWTMRKKPLMGYLFISLLGEAQLCAGLLCVSVLSIINNAGANEPISIGLIVVTVCMLVFVIPSSAFALRLVGVLGD